MEGNEYSGITSLVVPILSADDKRIKEIVFSVRDDDLTFIPFTEVAQKNKDYDSYKSDLSQIDPDHVSYCGIALAGSDKKVSKYTGALPLLK